MKKEKINLEEIRNIVNNANKVVFFGGAGVSTASGIPDFRSEEGIYNMEEKYGVSYETILSRQYFNKKPDVFYDFYLSTMINKKAKPNKAHKALAKFESKKNNLSIVTQNIDGLHQKAGSKVVYEIHGTTQNNHCVNCKCGRAYSLNELLSFNKIPLCKSCGQLIKPDVVLYGETLPQCFADARRACVHADVMIVAGTSLKVYPAARLVEDFLADFARNITEKKTLIIINNDATDYDHLADYVIHDKIEVVLPKILKEN